MNKLLLLCSLLGLGAASAMAASAKKIVLVAGAPSHGPGEHEHRAGCLLLAKCLGQTAGITAVVWSNGWPQSPDAFAGADAMFMYCDGGDGHPGIKPDRLKILNDLAAKGIGIGFCHYGVEVPKGEAGDAFLRWTGGYFETNWSVNPTWTAEFEKLPEHPITRGVKPFKIRDEWYYHMRFCENMRGVIPILTALPPQSTLGRPDGPHEGNPTVRDEVKRGVPQHVMWCTERADGGRGFGFTGAHYHNNWGDEDFRRVVLNALLWIAKAEVPAGGAQSTITPADLKENLDPKRTRP
jgi:type 1 glutamine amidotransferase